MINLNVNAFDEEYKNAAPKELACLLVECLSDEENKRLKEAWNDIGGYKVIPWWQWVLNNIDISLNKELSINKNNNLEGEEYDNR